MNIEPHSFDSDPEQLVAALLAGFRASKSYPRERVARLVKLAASEETRVAERASRAFFTSLVETLADSFEPAAVSFYNQAFAQLIQACRKTERGQPLDKKLREFGLLTEADVLARADRLRAAAGEHEPRDRPAVKSGKRVEIVGYQPDRVIVLSRVTLGADIAITSVIVERLKTTFPQAEIVLVGGRKASELFGGDPRLTFEEINYPGAADILDRLLAWGSLVDCVRELTRDAEAAAALPGDHWLIVDPDSRLTQLGLLPLASGGVGDPDAASGPRYLFFPSREYHPDSSASLAELTSGWLDEVLGSAPSIHPNVRLNRADLEAGRSLIDRLKREGHPVITVNFGVGGNPSKRVGDDFERRLVSSLLEDGATIVLDKGAGPEEARSADEVIEFARHVSKGPLSIVEIDEESLSRASSSFRIEAELLVWSGRIGLLAALIGASDLYIGYDSAGQHIAAALGVPCVDVFAGFSSRRMLDRWRPTGRAETRVVVVEQSMTEDEVLAETLRHARELKIRALTP
ncbi:MAG: glycosyltransferase family 9 protein [Acidobacteriota bacterium]